MVEKKKGKMVLVKVNELNNDELDATLDKVLETLLEDKEDKATKQPSHKRKATQVSRKKVE